MARFGAGQEDGMRAWSLEYLSNGQWLRVPGGKLTMRSNVLIVRSCRYMLMVCGWLAWIRCALPGLPNLQPGILRRIVRLQSKNQNGRYHVIR